MSFRTWFVTVATALTLATPASAQQAGALDDVGAPAAPVVMRRVPPTPRVTLERDTASARVLSMTESSALQPARARRSDSMALMIVGGAALLVGAVIGGDAGTLFMVGGGVMGLYGLYGYLR
jgi:hypothetical protein